MDNNIFKRLLPLFLLVLLTLSSCRAGIVASSGSTGDGDPEATPEGGDPTDSTQITVTGTLDGITISGESVDTILAIGNDSSSQEATITGDSFSLSLERGLPYLLVYLEGCTIIGVQIVDNSIGVDVLPVGDDSQSEVDLGTVALGLASGRIVGSTPGETLRTQLGFDETEWETYANMGVGLLRLSSLDVDGNCILDRDEGKSYDLTVDFEMASNSTFSAIQEDFYNPALASFTGYMYYFFAGDDTELSESDWSEAILAPPSPINGQTEEPQCYSVSESGHRTLNFFCGGTGYSPQTPPEGDYAVRAGSSEFTFLNIETKTIEPNLMGIYLPMVKLTMSDSKISQISWDWKKGTSSGWVDVSQEELAIALQGVSIEIGREGGSEERVFEEIDLTVSGTISAPAQSFTPGVFRIGYIDLSGFSYGIEWR